jgi:outer membrane protein OmpA-like peptidoglycan-associated protein/Mg-chelatase subunit ChlD
MAAFLWFFLAGASFGTEQLEVTLPGRNAHVTFQEIEQNRVIVSVFDQEQNPLTGLLTTDFEIRKGQRTTKIVGAEPFITSKDIGLNIVLVLDNSYSMKQRSAIEPLLAGLEELFKTIRPIDTVHVVVFDEKQSTTIDGRQLKVSRFESSDPQHLRQFCQQRFSKGLTNGTYLYDGVAAGIDLIKKMDAKVQKFLIVFSDGEDINSQLESQEATQAFQDLSNFAAYAVDYMEKTELDSFLAQIANRHQGKAWKVGAAADFGQIFKEFSSTLLHRYIVSYRFLFPPKATLAMSPQQLTIEEISTIDSAPLLNHIYFEEGQSDLPGKYVLLSGQEALENFREEDLKEVMTKYANLLNIIGSRLKNNPEATLQLVGCNANIGAEKNRLDLSKGRAEAVRAYLRYVWGINAARLQVEGRNLPLAPSTSRNAEGQAENRRVEIHSDHTAILDTVRSTYVQKVCDSATITVHPEVAAEAGVKSWRLTLFGDDQPLKTVQGDGDTLKSVTFDVAALGLEALAGYQTLSAGIEVVDTEGQTFHQPRAAQLPVRFVRREEQLAEKRGYRVREKYALILFDYDSAEIKARNQVVMGRILQRMQTVPNVQVQITGHTDNIGTEEYNLGLSQRRAEAVNSQIMQTGLSSIGDVFYSGVGPQAPLYDNLTPEGRALNRTVTVVLGYEANQ